jgi:HIRA B motif
MGSQDSGVSVWLTSTSRAIIVIKELFSHSVLDLAWSSDGLKLFACSYDGSIAEIEFEEKEFGTKLAEREVSERVERAGRVRVVPPESFEILQLEATVPRDDPMERLFDNHENMGLNGATIAPRTALITATQVPTALPTSSFTTTQLPLSTPSFTATQAPAQAPTASGISSTQTTPRKKFNISQQAVTIDKDGKKRIKPVLVQASLPITSPSKQFTDRENRSPSDRDGKRLRKDDIGVTSYTLPTIQQASKENLFKIPPIQKFFSTQVERFGNLDVTEIKNNANGYYLSQLGCVMTCSRDTTLIWKSSYNHPALLAVMTTKFTAIGFADSYIIIHSLSGKRYNQDLTLGCCQ